MTNTADFVFGPFRLDLTRDRLWRGQEAIELRARPLAVLRYLVDHAGEVVTRAELQQPVWAGIYVSKTALRVCVHEIREALRDEAAAPQYIETVGRLGYRFIAPLATPPPAHSAEPQGWDQHLTTDHWILPSYFVGREQELLQLHRWLESARAGDRQLVFVTGEAGVGKTTLVTAFLHRAQESSQLGIAHGQCVEQYGVGAPYLPLLDALRWLYQKSDAEQFVRLFAQHAPTWLAQLLPALPREQRNTLSLTVAGATHERMVRELADVLAMLSTERPIVLVLEDLHWSDAATVDVLAYLARRREPSRLLILGTYRSADIVIGEHPLRRLRQELLAHELCKDLQLELLNEKEVEKYVTQRLDGNLLAAELSPIIYQRTDGNALFVVNVVDYLLRQGLIQRIGDQSLTPEVVAAIESELPEGLQHLIQKEVEGLSPEEQRVLEAASVAGVYFTAAEVAAADQSEGERIEAVCDGLVRQQRLIEMRGTEEWPDGTLTTEYQFRHTVYQQVLGARMGQTQQVRLHRLMGERLETAYGARVVEVASHLAVHFECGRDIGRAVHYRQQAAEHALRQNAYREVHLHGAAGLALLETLPDTPERKQWELRVRQLVSAALAATRGFMDEGLEEHLERARQLCRELEDDATLVSVLVGLGRMQMVRADRAATTEVEQEEERLVERIQDAKLLVQLHTQLATIATYRGQHARAAEHYFHVLRHHDPKDLPFLLPSFSADPLIVASAWSGVSVSLAGQLEQGWSRAAEALVHAEELKQSLALVNGLLCSVLVKLFRREYDEARLLTHKLDTLARGYHFSLHKILSTLLQGCTAVQRGVWEEGIAGISTGLARYRATKARYLVPFFLSFLAEAYGHQGKIEEALQVVNDALSLTATNLDTFWEAELYRLKGELTLAQSRVQSLVSSVQKNQKTKGKKQKRSSVVSSQLSVPYPRLLTPDPQAEAEECFHKAIEIAHQQGAKLLELRAVTSWARLRHQQGKTAEAQQVLAETYIWFTEGFDTADLQTARALLAEWSVLSQNTAQSPRQRA